MKSKAFIIILLISIGTFIVYFFVKSQNPQVPKTRIGVPVPNIELTNFQKNRFKLSDLRGSVIFINFWATWCPPCIDELPSIERLSRKFKGNSAFRIVTILYNDDLDKANYFMKEFNYTFPVYIDSDGSAAEKFGITGVPETFIIDKNGILRNKIIGPSEWDSPYVIELLLKLLNE
ncbi:MAG: TlpA family protein disulfide reductase [Thermodesulfovibrionales bacterium]